MSVWRYFIPTEVHFGRGVLLQKGDSMRTLGKRALVVTGKSSSKNGSLDDLKKVLDGIGVEYEVFDGVRENPSFEILRKAREMYGDFEPDFVVGLGGGSPMDFAKAISVLLKNPGIDLPELYNTEKYSSMYPVVAIPTTSGTGSEATQYSVITDDLGNKRGFGTDFTFPTLSFVDPRYTLTMPADLTVSTGVDALCHAVEGYLSRRSNPLAKVLAMRAIVGIRDALPKVIKSLDDLELREEMMLSSTIAGMVIAQTGTTVNHAFGYPLTTFKGIRHGQATGLFLVENLKIMGEEVPEEVEEVLKPFGGLEGLEGVLKDLGIYDLRVEIEPEDIESWTEGVSKAKHLKVTPGRYDPDTIRRVYERVARRIG